MWVRVTECRDQIIVLRKVSVCVGMGVCVHERVRRAYILNEEGILFVVYIYFDTPNPKVSHLNRMRHQ